MSVCFVERPGEHYLEDVIDLMSLEERFDRSFISSNELLWRTMRNPPANPPRRGLGAGLSALSAMIPPSNNPAG